MSILAPLEASPVGMATACGEQRRRQRASGCDTCTASSQPSSYLSPRAIDRIGVPRTWSHGENAKRLFANSSPDCTATLRVPRTRVKTPIFWCDLKHCAVIRRAILLYVALETRLPRQAAMNISPNGVRINSLEDRPNETTPCRGPPSARHPQARFSAARSCGPPPPAPTVGKSSRPKLELQPFRGCDFCCFLTCFQARTIIAS